MNEVFGMAFLDREAVTVLLYNLVKISLRETNANFLDIDYPGNRKSM